MQPHRRSASSRLCVQRNTVRPSPRSARMNSRTVFAASGSSPVVGSSRNMMRGSCSAARATAIFCFLPRGGRAIESVHRREEHEVVPGGLPFVEAGLLGEDAHGGADLRVVLAQDVTCHLGAPGRGRDEGTQEAQSGGLSRAVRTQEAEDLAFPYLEIEAVDGGERAESLRQLFGADDGLHRSSLLAGSSFLCLPA